MKQALVVLIAGTVLSGIAAVYAANYTNLHAAPTAPTAPAAHGVRAPVTAPR